METTIEREYQGTRSLKDVMMNWDKNPLPELTGEELFQWQTLLEERTGIHIPEHRRSILQSSLSIRMREINCRSYADYLSLVKSKPAGVIEWSVLVDRLTIQETRYFRNPESLDLVSKYIQERLDQQQQPKIHLWSVGCSTGEEAYSLGIVAHDTIRQQNRQAYFGVTATDISLPALHKARRGCFDARRLEHLNTDIIATYFNKVNGQEYQIDEKVKNRVSFSMLNILEIAKSPLSNIDIIYCQNVLIYFKKEVKQEILNQLTEKLAPSGLLIIGQGEVTDWYNPKVARVDCNRAQAYQRKA